ncbi:MAG: ATP-binding response regulator, partial [Candidatus Binatia bacterium]
MKILIVDDRKSERILLDLVLKDAGYEVESAVDGADALEKLAAGEFDGVISDILMPVMDGFQFCREVKRNEKWRTLPFIFYSGTYTEEKDAELARDLGADKLLVKPTEPSALIKIVREVFASDRTRRATSAMPAVEDESTYFKLYNQRLIHQLEEKTTHLEETNQKLQESEGRLRANSEQLRALSAHLQKVREEERTHIAREIHDELGQALTALKMDVVSLADAGDLKSLKGRVKSMGALIDETVQTVRRIASELRPGILDDLGIVAALQWQAQ